LVAEETGVLLIAAFAIYVIVTKRLRITRSTTVTGDNARKFGIALLVLVIPFQFFIGVLLGAFLPAAARVWPIPQVLSGVLFAAIVISMAYYFRDAPTALPTLEKDSEMPVVSDDSPRDESR
jgi:hypothetical protein